MFGRWRAFPLCRRQHEQAGGSMNKLFAIPLLTGASAFAAHVSIGVGIGYPVYAPAPVAVYAAPPPPVYEEYYYRPIAPRPDYSWVSGYWYPSGPRYGWRAGYWARRPYA